MSKAVVGVSGERQQDQNGKSLHTADWRGQTYKSKSINQRT